MTSRESRHALPRKIIVGQQDSETIVHVALKFLAFVLFYRERLQLETNLHMATIPFIPDLVQLDYELRPRLWVECGECGVNKLHKLAVKIPDAEIWIVKRSPAAARQLQTAMEREELRHGRYHLLGFDPQMFDEVCALVQQRNEFLLVRLDFETCNLQFDFNGLWFDSNFTVLHY